MIDFKFNKFILKRQKTVKGLIDPTPTPYYFLKIVKNITSKGFVRSNYEEKLVDLSDVRINLKTKN